jgi:hypothetical protein
MKERGKYQIQCMKSRSSTGVGQKIDLEYNIETMRITDLAEDEQRQEFKQRTPSIYESIKTKSQIVPGQSTATESDESGKITADVQSTKLNQLLGAIKGNH